MYDVIIIGAGLSGLVSAYELEKLGLDYLLLEAKEKLGGRIETLFDQNGSSLELGATWLGTKHSHLTQLLDTLGIIYYPQELGNSAIYEVTSMSPPQLVQLPKNEEPSYRIKGGTFSLIQSLHEAINPNRINLNEPVISIKDKNSYLEVITFNGSYRSKKVISTLPPYLLTKTIECSPALPDKFVNIALNTHTWMGESIKIGLRYDKPFWKAKNSSGTIFSNVGPIQEMYDHSDENGYALKGFFNGTYFSLTKEERKHMALSQLAKYYGKVVHDFLSYEEKVWRDDQYVFEPYESHMLPHQNNGHPIFQNALVGGKLIIAGSETASAYPGYMDGAVESGKRAIESL